MTVSTNTRVHERELEFQTSNAMFFFVDFAFSVLAHLKTDDRRVVKCHRIRFLLCHIHRVSQSHRLYRLLLQAHQLGRPLKRKNAGSTRIAFRVESLGRVLSV